jgi:membrane-associated phospholipid phosphatase
VVCQIDSWDRNLANWAAKNRPIFGSRQSADDGTEYLVSALMATYSITALATFSGEKPKEWVWAKIKGFSVGAGAGVLTRLSTDGLKNATNRNRPDGSDRHSFPSDSSALAAVYGSMASRNLDYLALPKLARLGLRGGIAILMVGTSWARLEGKFHYPSDVLVGMALGNFIGAFLSDAFIGPNDPNIWLKVQPAPRGALVSLHWAY